MKKLTITSNEDLENLKKRSYERDVLIFKHSTRCNISADALAHMESAWKKDDVPFYYLDLLSHRDISDKIEIDFGVRHQSPQVLLIRKGECIYNESHWRIDAKKIEEVIS
jgi:bacillithiol system protein YtxJ